MTDSTQELDGILSQLMKDAITNRRADDPPQGRKMLLNEAKQALLDWHNKQVEEIIGEDEKTDYPAPASWVGEDAAIRNKLRAEQRQRAKGGEIV